MCSSRGTDDPASTAEISTAVATRTPTRSPSAIASETPLIVSWSDSASSSTPAAAARCTTSAAGRTPSEGVECDCRSKRGATRAAYAIASGGGVAVHAGPADGGFVGYAGERGDAPRDDRAQTAHGGGVAARLLEEDLVGGSVAVELIAGGVGLDSALARVEPQHLEVCKRCAHLVLVDRVRLLELAHGGDHLGDQPALLSVSPKDQADVGRVRGAQGVVVHRKCSHWEKTGGSVFGFFGLRQVAVAALGGRLCSPRFSSASVHFAGDSRRGRGWTDEGCGGSRRTRIGKRDAKQRHRPDTTYGGAVRTGDRDAAERAHAGHAGCAGGRHGAAGPHVRAARPAVPGLGGDVAGEHVRDLALRAAAGGAP